MELNFEGRRKNEVIFLVIMFIPSIMDIKMSKMAHFLFC